MLSGGADPEESVGNGCVHGPGAIRTTAARVWARKQISCSTESTNGADRCRPQKQSPYASCTPGSALLMAESTSCFFSSRRLPVSASRFSRTTGSVWDRRMLNHHSG